MYIGLALAIAGAALHLGTALLTFAISRAPGWRSSRAFAFVALTAALYGLVDIGAGWRPWGPVELAWLYRVNIFNASLHASAWLWFMFGDHRAPSPRVTRWLPWAVAAVIVPTIVILVASEPIDPTRTVAIPLDADGATRRIPIMTAAGYLAAAGALLAFTAVAVAHVRNWVSGQEGARARAVGYLLFMLCVANEALVAGGVVSLPFLADLGFLFAVVPVVVQTVNRFRADADRLIALTAEQAQTISERTAERDQAQGVLVKQERLTELGRLAAGVGHEVNNPLAYVAANLDILRADSGITNAESRAALVDALDGVERISKVVESLRTYARPASDQPELVPLARIADDALRIAQTGFRTRVSLRRGDMDDALHVRGDEGRLVQLLVNLLVNGAQAVLTKGAGGPDGAATVTLSTRRLPDGRAELEVVDTGPGFDPAIMPRVGQPYVTTAAAEGRSGLGLFVSQGIVHEHRGELVIARAPTGGASVRVRLPAATAEEVAATPPPPTPVRRPVTPTSLASVAQRVLLVDDEPLVVSALARVLTRRGFTVDVASNAADAVERVNAGQDYAAIVSDLMMPGMNGIEFAGYLAEHRPQLRHRLIVLTGGAVSRAAEAFIARDDVRVLHKPVPPDELVRAIRSVTEAAAS